MYWLYKCSSLSLLNLWLPKLSNVKSTLSPNGSKALECNASISSSISFKDIPPILLTVPVKYFSITSSFIPIASKICDPWYDWIVEIPILDAIFTIPFKIPSL